MQVVRGREVRWIFLLEHGLRSLVTHGDLLEVSPRWTRWNTYTHRPTCSLYLVLIGAIRIHPPVSLEAIPQFLFRYLSSPTQPSPTSSSRSCVEPVQRSHPWPQQLLQHWGSYSVQASEAKICWGLWGRKFPAPLWKSPLHRAVCRRQTRDH